MTSSKSHSPRIGLRTWDNILLWGSLTSIVGLAWWYFFVLSRDMAAISNAELTIQDMAGMQSWGVHDFLMMLMMWTVMMIGMMLPTAIRAILIYVGVASTASQRGSPVASTIYFVTGYVVVWTGFSVGATVLQAALGSLGLLSPGVAASSARLGAVLLILAGAYQLTPWKDACLDHCQAPATYLAGRFGPKVTDGIGLGMRHGAYCLGCCWLLMVLLFVGGVMNLLWIAAITGFVLLEKLLPRKLMLQQLAAVSMLGIGVAFLVKG